MQTKVLVELGQLAGLLKLLADNTPADKIMESKVMLLQISIQELLDNTEITIGAVEEFRGQVEQALQELNIVYGISSKDPNSTLDSIKTIVDLSGDVVLRSGITHL